MVRGLGPTVAKPWPRNNNLPRMTFSYFLLLAKGPVLYHSISIETEDRSHRRSIDALVLGPKNVPSDLCSGSRLIVRWLQGGGGGDFYQL